MMRNKKRGMLFETAAKLYIETHQAGWGQLYIDEWESTLRRYVNPIIGKRPIAKINTALVVKILKPIWMKYPVMAMRVRSRIEAVLNWGKAQGLRTGENPARWRGHLQSLFPRTSRIRTAQHYPSLHYSKMGDLIVGLRRHKHCSDHPLEFMILTATRSREALQAKWPEFDLEKSVWEIPAERMKLRRVHRVPLSVQAIALLRFMEQHRTSSDYVFPGFKHGKPLSQPLMQLRVKDLGHSEATIHGFRSTFRDWAAEHTNFPREVIAFSLSHKLGDRTEAAYFRTDMFAKRAKLMQAWADYCDLPSGEEHAGGYRRIGGDCAPALYAPVEPRDELETMLTAQMAAVHAASSECLRMAEWRGQCGEVPTLALRAAGSCTQAYAALVEALSSYRARTMAAARVS